MTLSACTSRAKVALAGAAVRLDPLRKGSEGQKQEFGKNAPPEVVDQDFLGHVALKQPVAVLATRRRVPGRSSISWQSRLIWVFEMPVIPSALTRSSTERVETPWM